MNVDPERGHSMRSEWDATQFGGQGDVVFRCPVVFASLDHRLMAGNAFGVKGSGALLTAQREPPHFDYEYEHLFTEHEHERHFVPERLTSPGTDRRKLRRTPRSEADPGFGFLPTVNPESRV
ncbi:hypothetical protein Pla100_56560 [Neorhodopirellula pilleata]|uniref:Uncharacterized protein n=1 Tax=Neorhodopirellula pilleata TaxID=2714738 RepID=A0A5C5ZP10_9BACT|nr:hypothetical protein Pla100_56560 [Neorhodopirellula pilleata]